MVVSADCRLYVFGGLSFGGLSIDCYSVGGLSDNRQDQLDADANLAFPNHWVGCLHQGLLIHPAPNWTTVPQS